MRDLWTPDVVLLVEDVQFELKAPDLQSRRPVRRIPIKVKDGHVLTTGLVEVLPPPALGVIIGGKFPALNAGAGRSNYEGPPLTPTDTNGDGIADTCVDNSGGNATTVGFQALCTSACQAMGCNNCTVTIDPPACSQDGDCILCPEGVDPNEPFGPPYPVTQLF